MMIDRFLNSLPADIIKSPTIHDVGNCTGEQSREFASVFPDARIFAFEANPDSASVVRRTVFEFPNIDVVQAAVCDFDGQIEFHASVEGNPGASSLYLASGHNDISPIIQRSSIVRSIRLDTWAKSRDIHRFDLVWMDLQGAELRALNGMGHMLQTVRAIQLEVTYRELYDKQAMWPEVREFLESKGFHLVDEWPDICEYFGDAVFLRNSD
jgi:FkbM family methyltransferase